MRCFNIIEHYFCHVNEVFRNSLLILNHAAKDQFHVDFFFSSQVVSLSDYDYVQEVTKEGSKKSPSPGYPLVCVTPCDPHYPKYSVMRERCEEAGINQTSVHFSWEVATPTDTNGARSPFETVTDNTPYTTVNHMVSLMLLSVIN